MRRVLYLASSSPRRRQLLRDAGIPFEVIEPGPEPEGSGSPKERAMQRAHEKAVGARSSMGGLILGVDTVVALGDEEFGKPPGRTEAGAMLRRLAGRDHEVFSAHCLFDPSSGVCYQECAVATVRWSTLDDEALERYLDTDDWRDKAGAYGIQSAAAAFVTLIAGDRDTVVGLHVPAVQRLLESAA